MIFIVMTLVFFGWGILKRRKMTTQSKQFRIKAAMVEDISPVPEAIPLPMQIQANPPALALGNQSQLDTGPKKQP
jgi:hypothetical protein